MWYFVANTCEADGGIPLVLLSSGLGPQCCCSSLVSLVFSHSPFQTSSKLPQRALLAAVLQVLFPSEKGSCCQMSVDQVLNRSAHSQKPHNFLAYTSLGDILVDLAIPTSIIPSTIGQGNHNLCCCSVNQLSQGCGGFFDEIHCVR